MTTEFYEKPERPNRQAEIDALAPGQSVALARRIDPCAAGPGSVAVETKALRGVMDSQVHRARTKFADRTYKVEGLNTLTGDGAVLIAIIATRTT